MSSSYATSTSVAIVGGHGTVLNALPRDIIHTHILTRLDSLSLASFSCVSHKFHLLCINEDLWRKICHDTWPSINDPRVHKAVAALPFGYRSLFSSSFSSFHRCKNISDCEILTIADELISAVDMRFMGRSVYSKIQVTNTATKGFLSEPTWVNMMNPKANATSNHIEFDIANEDLLSLVAQNLTLSWILIYPTSELVANLSSLQPVLVESHFLKGHVRIRYSTILTIEDSASEMSEIRIAVTCRFEEGGEVQVKEMTMVMLDKYGRNMKWKDSLVILHDSRKGREKYKEYLKKIGERRREREIAEMREFKIEGIICMLFYSVVLLPFLICCFSKRYILRRREK